VIVSTKKIDFKHELIEFYGPRSEPVIVNVPDLNFLMIDGTGDPNTSSEFSHAIEALYSIAYTAKFTIKRTSEGVDYVVMPLEGQFWVPNMSAFSTDDKSTWKWTLMIMQPDAVTSKVFAEVRETAHQRKTELDAMARVRLERFAEGLAAQVVHTGPYDAEGPTVARLHAFIEDQGYSRTGRHHEIYLSDPNRAAPEKMKTIVRQPIAHAK
jgi:hypothetical protein